MDRRDHLIEALRKGMNETMAFFASLTADQLAVRVYQDGARWTTQQVLAHLITIERSMHWLFNNILSGGAGSPENFDVDRYNLSQTRKLDVFNLPALIGQFKAVRLETIAMVEAMKESDLDREGRHAFHGEGKLERFLHWAHEHARIHEDEIRKTIGR